MANAEKMALIIEDCDMHPIIKEGIRTFYSLSGEDTRLRLEGWTSYQRKFDKSAFIFIISGSLFFKEPVRELVTKTFHAINAAAKFEYIGLTDIHSLLFHWFSAFEALPEESKRLVILEIIKNIRDLLGVRKYEEVEDEDQKKRKCEKRVIPTKDCRWQNKGEADTVQTWRVTSSPVNNT